MPRTPLSVADRLDAAVTERSKQESEFRTHLGASVIGRECDRELWFSFHWVTETIPEPRLQRLFDRGHREEHVLVTELNAAGYTVHDTDPVTGEQFRLVGVDGHYGGALDGIAYGEQVELEPDQPFLVEFKTSNTKVFNKMKKDGVAITKPEHYVQMVSYMSAYELPKALYIMVCKENDDRHYEWVLANDERAQEYTNRAEHIIASSEPPLRINSSPSWYACKWCDHHAVCQTGKKLPEINCRTCAHSTPISGGYWVCEAGHGDGEVTFNPDTTISTELQRTGCKYHQYHPHLLERTRYQWLGGTDYLDKRTERVVSNDYAGDGGTSSRDM